MLRKYLLFLVAIFVYSIATAQYTVSPKITEMQWDKGFGVRLKLSNDSNYVLTLKNYIMLHQNHIKIMIRLYTIRRLWTGFY